MVIMSLYSLEGDFPDRNGIHILLVMTNCIFTAHSPGKRNENSVPHSAAGQHETSQADSCWYDLQQDHPWSQNLYPYTCQTEMSCHYGSFLRYQMLPGLHLIEGEHSLPCIETNTVYSHTHINVPWASVLNEVYTKYLQAFIYDMYTLYVIQ